MAYLVVYRSTSHPSGLVPNDKQQVSVPVSFSFLFFRFCFTMLSQLLSTIELHHTFSKGDHVIALYIVSWSILTSEIKYASPGPSCFLSFYRFKKKSIYTAFILSYFRSMLLVLVLCVLLLTEVLVNLSMKTFLAYISDISVFYFPLPTAFGHAESTGNWSSYNSVLWD